MDTIQVKTSADIKQLSALAEEIWNEAFAVLLTQGQIKYMLNKFLSENAITESIKEGYEYYYLSDCDRILGFTAVCPKDDGSLFLSKLYLKKEERGKGYLKEVFDFLKSLSKEKKLNRIWLTVNKQNHRAIAGYKKMGMSIIRSEVTDIGEGYVMDDYVFSIDV